MSEAYRMDWKEELIDGKVVAMSPASVNHVLIAGNIFNIFKNYLKGKRCVPIVDGALVYLTEEDHFIPDMVVVCNPDKIKPDGVHGAPDLVVEILSPSSLRHDRFVKLGLYQRAGVREYWIVDPEYKSVQVFTQDGGGSLRISEEYGREDVARVNVLEGCFIDLSKVFFE